MPAFESRRTLEPLSSIHASCFDAPGVDAPDVALAQIRKPYRAAAGANGVATDAVELLDDFIA